MLFFEVVRVSFDSLRVNKMRALLTALGIVIGVAAVIAMTALGNGASQAVQARITALGTRLLQVDAARQLVGGIAVQNPVRLTERDATSLAAFSWPSFCSFRRWA
jgi:putative ABC transport system permease protein